MPAEDEAREQLREEVWKFFLYVCSCGQQAVKFNFQWLAHLYMRGHIPPASKCDAGAGKTQSKGGANLKFQLLIRGF